jgi:hypothetical protein
MNPPTTIALSRRAIALVLGLALLITTVVGVTAAAAGPPPLVPCRQRTVGTVTVTLSAVGAAAAQQCATAPGAETLETCLLLMATYLGRMLTREQAALCFPALPEGMDADVGGDAFEGTGVSPPVGPDRTVTITDTANCDGPPDPGAAISQVQGTLSVGGTLDVNGKGVVVDADVKLGPLSITRPLDQIREAINGAGGNGPGKAGPEPAGPEAQKKADGVIENARKQTGEQKGPASTAAPTPTTPPPTPPPTTAPPSTAPPSTEPPKPSTPETTKPSTSPSEAPKPSTPDSTASGNVAHPVGPDGPGTGMDGLPCQVAAAVCSAFGKKLAPAMCEAPELSGRKGAAGGCDPTRERTTGDGPCQKDQLTPQQLEDGREVARRECEAVAHIVQGEDPCGDPGAAFRHLAGSGIATPEQDCRSLVHTTPDGGGTGTGTDPCAPGTGLTPTTQSVGAGPGVPPVVPAGAAADLPTGRP